MLGSLASFEAGANLRRHQKNHIHNQEKARRRSPRPAACRRSARPRNAGSAPQLRGCTSRRQQTARARRDAWRRLKKHTPQGPRAPPPPPCDARSAAVRRRRWPGGCSRRRRRRALAAQPRAALAALQLRAAFAGGCTGHAARARARHGARRLRHAHAAALPPGGRAAARTRRAPVPPAAGSRPAHLSLQSGVRQAVAGRWLRAVAVLRALRRAAAPRRAAPHAPRDAAAPRATPRVGTASRTAADARSTAPTDPPSHVMYDDRALP
jgi:hypothetical protein